MSFIMIHPKHRELLPQRKEVVPNGNKVKNIILSIKNFKRNVQSSQIEFRGYFKGDPYGKVSPLPMVYQSSSSHLNIDSYCSRAHMSSVLKSCSWLFTLWKTVVLSSCLLGSSWLWVWYYYTEMHPRIFSWFKFHVTVVEWSVNDTLSIIILKFLSYKFQEESHAVCQHPCSPWCSSDGIQQGIWILWDDPAWQILLWNLCRYICIHLVLI